MSPYPAAWTVFDEGDKQLDIKIFKTGKGDAIKSGNVLPGTINTDGKSFLRVATSDAWLDILSLQQAGKKRMGIADFLRGFKIAEGKFV